MIVFKTWHEAYRHIALKLNDFYTANKGNNVAQKIYALLKDSEFYNVGRNAFFQYDVSENPSGLDPIQLFAGFNYTRIKDPTRVKLINLLFKVLDPNVSIDHKTDFEGIPSPIITQIAYNRKIEIQEEIWSTFNKVVEGGFNGLTQRIYNSHENWYGIGLSAFTIFLFWIDSDVFLPLDQNTSTFIVGLRLVESKPWSYEEYTHICQKISIISLGSIRTVVKEAYSFVLRGGGRASIELLDVLNKFSIPTNVKAEVTLEDFSQSAKQNFKIIALRPTKEQKHLKNLGNHQLYKFYSAYNFHDGDIIEYWQGADEYLYNDTSLRISISAIVGENGSGKSAITELVLLVLNRLAQAYDFSPGDYPFIAEDIHADLFVKTDSIYKISIDETIRVWRYAFVEELNRYEPSILIVDKEENIRNFNIRSLFYTIVSNYSLYGLNSRVIGNWIRPFFHKNDSYQIPVVLNPKRIAGGININIEESLSKSRLLANVLDPSRLDIINKHTQPLINGKRPTYLKIILDDRKLLKKREKYFDKKILNDSDLVMINDAVELFNLEIIPSDSANDVKEYVYYKLISMSSYIQFERYKDIFSDGVFDSNVLPSYIEAVLTEPSHVTFKIKQALNYLEYGHFNVGRKNKIFDLSLKIGRIQGEKFEESPDNSKQKLKTIELIPPSIFKTNIVFEDGHSFNKLSSGEKQQIFSINTIAYHLTNIDSIEEKDNIVKYNCVNIIFDEVELYFHPDMQRTYINNLRERIVNLQLEFSRNINIMFVTHSPFILSDIPTSNLLKLKKGIPQPNDGQTFGANVYDLLANEFFLNGGTIGEFSKSKIEDIIDKLQEWRNSKDTNANLFKQDRRVIESREGILHLITIIGDHIVREKLLEMYWDLFDYKSISGSELVFMSNLLKKIEKND